MTTFSTIARGDQPVASYEPLVELGRGGMGVVRLARAVGIGGFERLVVVKRLHPHLLEEGQAVARFLDEAKTAASIHHANVVGIHQIGEDAQGLFLVLDYVEGGSLDELVDRAGLKGSTIPTEIVLRIGLDALAGLQAVHEATDPVGRPLGILHRDVSLQNVLVGKDGVARLADFGIAKSTMASVATDTRYLVGKLLYLPREYLKREPVGPTLDVYSLGVTLWIALAGEDPWPDGSEGQLVAQILEGVPRLSARGVVVAPQIAEIVERACAPDPAARFQTAREMAERIEAVGRDTGWIASHGEVARFLDALLAKDLARRRERIAEALASLEDRVTHTEIPLVVQRPGGPETPAAWTGDPDTEVTVPLRRGPPAALIGGVALLAAAGAGLAWAASTPRGAADPVRSAASDTTTPEGAAPEPSARRPTSVHHRDAAPSADAATSASSRAPAPRPPEPAPPRSEARAAPAPAATPAPEAPAPALAPAPAAAPAALQDPGEPPAPGISKANPYR